MTISEFFKKKYSARKDKENIYGVWNTNKKEKQKQERNYLKRLGKMPISIDFKSKN